ncbi:hypothetical protein CRUP_022985, partial [Coryphaenoides rupestris]
MDVALKQLKFLKVGCFAHTLNLAAQKVYSISAVTKWCARLRAVVVWLKRSTMAKTVLRKKQQLLERLTDDDFRKAEEFIAVMRLLYTSTLAISSEKSPTCGQILPILGKLEVHFKVAEKDTIFTTAVKEKVWEDLEKRYQDKEIQNFLQEATLMDPRFKSKLGGAAADAWDRLEEAAVGSASEQLPEEEHQRGFEEQSDDHEEETADEHPPSHKRAKKSALEELFEEEDQELQAASSITSGLSMAE